MTTESLQKTLAAFVAELQPHLTPAPPVSTPTPVPTTTVPTTVEDASPWGAQMKFLDEAYHQYANIPERQKHAMIRLGFKQRFDVDAPTMKKVFGKGKRLTPEPEASTAATTPEPTKEKKPRTTPTPVPSPTLSSDAFKSQLSQLVGGSSTSQDAPTE